MFKHFQHLLIAQYSFKPLMPFTQVSQNPRMIHIHLNLSNKIKAWCRWLTQRFQWFKRFIKWSWTVTSCWVRVRTLLTPVWSSIISLVLSKPLQSERNLITKTRAAAPTSNVLRQRDTFNTLKGKSMEKKTKRDGCRFRKITVRLQRNYPLKGVICQRKSLLPKSYKANLSLRNRKRINMARSRYKRTLII